MKNGKILWADDEIDLLKPHILFLQQKGYEVTTVSNGRDALEKAAHETFDLIILDENMPGLSGLDTLGQIKMENPEIPVVMITKSEEENIMNQAIGNKILPHQAGQSQSDSPLHKEKSPPQRDHLGKDIERLSTGVPTH